jgi:hypothetical protein
MPDCMMKSARFLIEKCQISKTLLLGMFQQASIALYKYTKNGSLDNERMVYMGYYPTDKIRQKRTVHNL